MPQVINVRFRGKGKAYYFDPGDNEIHSGDAVIVETSRGSEIGECVRAAHYVEDTAIVPPLRPVIRVATAADKRLDAANRQKEKTAFDFCQKKIAERGLDMKLVEVEYSFDGSKILFFFTSEDRVDFRDLVKDLAGVFRTRIELRQIGVRDSAKLVGGLGICGRPFCCSTFLDSFQPVSIKMAKTQSLSLNPTKISGTCGRLMCCLKYEQDAYENLLRTVPKVDAAVDTPDGKGTVTEVNLLRRTVKVRLEGEGTNDTRAYPARELGFTIGGVYKAPEPPEEKPEQTEEDVSFYGFASRTRLDPMPARSLSEPTGADETEDKPAKSQRQNERRRRRSKKPQDAAGQPKQSKQDEPQPEKKDNTEGQRQNERRRRTRPAKPAQDGAGPQQDKPAANGARPPQDKPQVNGARQPQDKPQAKQNNRPPRPPRKNDGARAPADDKARARADAIAEAVAQAKPKRPPRRRHRGPRPGGEPPKSE